MKSRRDLVRAEFGETMDHVRQAAAHAAGGLGAGVGPSLGSARDTARAARESGRARAVQARESGRARAVQARERAASAGSFRAGSFSDALRPAAGRVSSGWDGAMANFAPLAEAARAGSVKAVKLDSKNGKSDRVGKSGTSHKGRRSTTKITTTESESSSHTGLYAILATGMLVGAAGAFVARRRTRAKWAEYEPSSLHSDASTFHNAGATSKTSLGGTESLTSDGTVTRATNWTMEHARSAMEAIRHKIHEATADHPTTGAINKAVDPADATRTDATRAEAPKTEVTRPAAETKLTGAAGIRTDDRTSDEVDDLIRSAKNGHM